MGMSDIAMKMEENNMDSAVRKEKSSARKENHTGIPTQLKERMEQSTGLSFDDVRVHYNSDLPARLDALAYTRGNQVEIGPGQERHLPHELGHVVQQKLGAVRANAMHSSGVALNTDAGLEHQADEIGAGKKISASSGEQSQVIQLYKECVVADKELYDKTPPTNSDKKHSFGDSKKPMMVFESMGTQLDDCEKIYEQTCNYDGNTICVFGLNENNKKNNLAKLQENVKKHPIKTDARKNGFLHLLYLFAFTWEPLDKEKNDGYEMPFIEARLVVMDNAEKIVEENIGEDNNHVLYRWIDADAREDTSNDVSPAVLNLLAHNGDPKILSGRYDWQHENGAVADVDPDKVNAETCENTKLYDLFFMKVNEAEHKLRNYFHYLSNQRNANAENSSEERYGIHERALQDTDFKGKYGLYKKIDVKKGNFLPGYYLPETALVMNKIAHKTIRSKLHKQLEALGKDETMMVQVKESMQAAGMLTGKDVIMYDPKLSVQKPLKNEFAQNSYWGDNMLSFLSKDPTEEELEKHNKEPKGSIAISAEERIFIDALKNLRQSAFKKWYFKEDSDWNNWEDWRENEKYWATYPIGSDEYLQKWFNIKKCTLEMELWIFLQTVNKDGGKPVLRLIRDMLSKPKTKKQ